MINQRKTQYSWTTPRLIHNNRKIIFIMETADEGLTINSNTAMNGVEMVFGWGYSYSSSLVEAPQQFNTFSLAISTKNLSDETAHPKPNPFLSGHNNKRRPTHIVNLLFYNETR